jgi:radical SAM protein with 4Fe4S-binding SPASM domain
MFKPGLSYFMIVNPYQVAGLLPQVLTALDMGVLGRHFPRLYEGMYVPLRTKIHDIRVSRDVNAELSRLLDHGEAPIFSSIEIETINRCNGACSFCPVNRMADSRPLKLMERSLFESIVQQLAELDFRGSLAIQGNNEPLLDGRVYEFCEMARKCVPNAYLEMFSNGSLLSVERLKDLMRSLDHLVIDSYDDGQKLRGAMRDVAKVVEGDPALKERVFIYLRRENLIRSNRGGKAPNRKSIIHLSSRCILPFIQMCVRPDGKLSLCCCDAYGSMTMGDLNEERILEAWQNDRYREARQSMLAGRGNIEICKACDVVNRTPFVTVPNPMAKPNPKSVISIVGA